MMPERLNQFLTANNLTWTSYPLRENHATLKEGERAVLGYFPGRTEASQAYEKIKAMGFEIAQLEPVKRNGLRNNLEDDHPSFSEYRMVGDYPFMVTVVTENERAPEVTRVMEDNGGYV